MDETNNIRIDNNRALYLIVEGKTDAAILRTLLNCEKFDRVYQVPAGGYGNISSVAKTIRLMKMPMESIDKIVIAFDADSTNEQTGKDKVLMMRNLTSADYDKRIGVFCFVPTMDGSLFPEGLFKRKEITEELVDYMKGHIEDLRANVTIRAIQAFINE